MTAPTIFPIVSRAALPGSGAFAGQALVVSGTMYVWSGSAWVAAGGGGGGGGGWGGNIDGGSPSDKPDVVAVDGGAP